MFAVRLKKSGKAAHYGLHRSYLRYFLKTRQNILEKKNTEWPTQPYTIWENILSYQCSNNIDATPQTASLKPPWNLTSQIQAPDPGFHFTKEWSQDPNAAKIHRLYRAIECTQCWFKTTISSGTKTWSIFLFLLWLQLISLPGSKRANISSKLMMASEKMLYIYQSCFLPLSFDYCWQLSPLICIPHQS